MVLRSAIVIIGCVGSLIMLPGATESAVMLPPTGAVTVSSPARGLGSGGGTERFQMRLRSRVFGGGLSVVALGLIQIPVRNRSDLVLLLAASPGSFPSA